MATTISACPNCTAEIIGNYCHECGQKSADTKYTLRGMMYDLVFSTFHIEKKGLPHTLRELTLRPGQAVLNVVDGQRLFLYPAFKYLVLMGALVIVFSLRYNFFHNEVTQVNENHTLTMLLGLDVMSQQFLASFFKFAEDEATLLNIMAVPVFTFFSWALLSRRRFNFAENLILNTYITAQQLFFLLLTVPIIEFFPFSKEIIIGGYTILIMTYNVWVYYKFFVTPSTKIATALLSSLAVLFAFIYQLPLNMLVYYLYENYVHPHIHWVPSIVP